MAMIVGSTLALIVGVLATLLRLDRERAFYATVAMVVATYYVLFAAMGASLETLMEESAVGIAFIVTTALGFRISMWIVVAALAGHGALDLVHGHVISNPGVPAWWPPFCMAYDFIAAAYLAVLLAIRGRAVGIVGGWPR
jgi:hypothetical protein